MNVPGLPREVQLVSTGAITEYIDVAQIVLYVFWAFFAGLIIYLRREDKREGYPLVSDRPGRSRPEGFPRVPSPKTFLLADGSTYSAPHEEHDPRTVQAEPTAAWPGAPLEPIGDPMLAEVGPGAYALRPDRPELSVDGVPRIVPMRVATGYDVESRDPDPRGMDVFGADGAVAGKVSDIWVDLAESQVRYLEVDVAGSPEAGTGARSALVPIALARIDRRRGRVAVASILARQFAQAPKIQHESQVTQLEEERICAYFASGHLYAVPARRESLL